MHCSSLNQVWLQCKHTVNTLSRINHRGWMWLTQATLFFPRSNKNKSLHPVSSLVLPEEFHLPVPAVRTAPAKALEHASAHTHSSLRRKNLLPCSKPNQSFSWDDGCLLLQASPGSHPATRTQSSLAPACLQGHKAGKGRHVCLQYACPFWVFIPNTCFSFYAKHVFSVFCLLSFISKCSIFMAWGDKDMRRGGKVVQKAIKSGGWLL